MAAAISGWLRRYREEFGEETRRVDVCLQAVGHEIATSFAVAYLAASRSEIARRLKDELNYHRTSSPVTLHKGYL